MLDCVHLIELHEAGARDRMHGFAGGVRNKMKVKPCHRRADPMVLNPGRVDSCEVTHSSRPVGPIVRFLSLICHFYRHSRQQPIRDRADRWICAFSNATCSLSPYFNSYTGSTSLFYRPESADFRTTRLPFVRSALGVHSSGKSVNPHDPHLHQFTTT